MIHKVTQQTLWWMIRNLIISKMNMWKYSSDDDFVLRITFCLRWNQRSCSCKKMMSDWKETALKEDWEINCVHQRDALLDVMFIMLSTKLASVRQSVNDLLSSDHAQDVKYKWFCRLNNSWFTFTDESEMSLQICRCSRINLLRSRRLLYLFINRLS